MHGLGISLVLGCGGVRMLNSLTKPKLHAMCSHPSQSAMAARESQLHFGDTPLKLRFA